MYYCIANWKMNIVELREARRLFDDIKIHASRLKNTRAVICPSNVHLHPLSSDYKGKKISFGAQDLFYEKEGSFTGFVSGHQLKNAGADYCIVGHSERRLRGETVEDRKEKLKAALRSDLVPILCFGEKDRDEAGHYLSELANQITDVIDGLTSEQVSKIIFAYEPIWAIGKSDKDAMDAHEMYQMVLYVRKILKERFNEDVATGANILYGGSVESTNAEDLIKHAHIDGFLVGHASLNARHFGLILDIVDKSSK